MLKGKLFRWIVVFFTAAAAAIFLGLTFKRFYNPYAVAYDEVHVQDVNGDGIADVLWVHDQTSVDVVAGKNKPRQIFVSAYSGRDLKPLWNRSLPKNLGLELSGVLKTFLFENVLIQHWYTGFGFMDLKSGASTFHEVEPLMESPCEVEGGVMARTRTAPRTLVAEAATSSLREDKTGLLCRVNDPESALKRRCERLGSRCAVEPA